MALKIMQLCSKTEQTVKLISLQLALKFVVQVICYPLSAD